MDLLNNEIFGIQLFDSAKLVKLILKFLLNLFVTGFITYFLYYRKTQRKDYLMTFTLINLTVFFLVFLLDSVKLQIGFALGLFAIFGIIRYRTIVIPIKEMTYLFVIIGVSVMNALANNTVSFVELIVANLAIILFCWLFESRKIRNHTSHKVVIYDNMQLIKSGKEAELKQDLAERLGLEITKVEVGMVDFLRDSAILNVYYKNHSNEINSAETMDKDEWKC
jgi:hypothetical protein